jgi:plastocyanin
MQRVLAVAMLAAVACTGRREADQGQAAADRSESPGTPAAAPVQQGAVHDVMMRELADGRFVFEPASLEIRVGDRVRWVNESGGVHNVAFYADRIPAGAKDVLNAAMPDRLADLTGRLLEQAGDTYEISFAGAPPGTYDYYCTPHEMLGMTAQLTVVR